jgi:hypothetical protein
VNPQPPDFWAVAGDREPLDLAVPRWRVVAFLSARRRAFFDSFDGYRYAAGLFQRGVV